MKNIALIKDEMQSSTYINFIKKNYGLIVFTLLISVILVLLTYPGILYSDSYTRIAMADNIKLRFQVVGVRPH